MNACNVLLRKPCMSVCMSVCPSVCLSVCLSDNETITEMGKISTELQASLELKLFEPTIVLKRIDLKVLSRFFSF